MIFKFNKENANLLSCMAKFASKTVFKAVKFIATNEQLIFTVTDFLCNAQGSTDTKKEGTFSFLENDIFFLVPSDILSKGIAYMKGEFFIDVTSTSDPKIFSENNSSEFRLKTCSVPNLEKNLKFQKTVEEIQKKEHDMLISSAIMDDVCVYSNIFLSEKLDEQNMYNINTKFTKETFDSFCITPYSTYQTNKKIKNSFSDPKKNKFYFTINSHGLGFLKEFRGAKGVYKLFDLNTEVVFCYDKHTFFSVPKGTFNSEEVSGYISTVEELKSSLKTIKVSKDILISLNSAAELGNIIVIIIEDDVMSIRPYNYYNSSKKSMFGEGYVRAETKEKLEEAVNGKTVLTLTARNLSKFNLLKNAKVTEVQIGITENTSLRPFSFSTGEDFLLMASVSIPEEDSN